MGYGDITATYIRWAKIPSHMYAKYQYNTGVRVQKYIVLYIQQKRTSILLSQSVT